jgi:hypothetical protein
MFIHGGIDDDENYLDDCYLLNLSPLKWHPVIVDPDCEQPTLAWHSSCLVLPAEQRLSGKLKIYTLPEINISKRSTVKVKIFFV